MTDCKAKAEGDNSESLCERGSKALEIYKSVYKVKYG